MDRVKTGIPGMDDLMGGGIPRKHICLVTGTAGTGKSTLCAQFIFNGIAKFNENGVYLSFEEPEDSMRENLKTHGWNFDDYETRGQFSFIRYDPYHIEDVFDVLESTIRQTKAKRVVIDSVSALGLHIKDDAELRRMIFNLSVVLRKLECTALLVSEIPTGSKGLSRYGVEEFVADSVVVLYYERMQSSFSRAIQIWKVRGSGHSEKLHPYKIGTEGFITYPNEEAFMGSIK